MQRPESFPVCVGCPCAHADKFSSFCDKNFLFGEVSCEKKIRHLLFDDTNTNIHCACGSWWSSCPGGCMTSSGGRGISPSIGKGTVHPRGPFQWQNCINKENVWHNNTCSLILCGAHCKLCEVLLREKPRFWRFRSQKVRKTACFFCHFHTFQAAWGCIWLLWLPHHHPLPGHSPCQ